MHALLKHAWWISPFGLCPVDLEGPAVDRHRLRQRRVALRAEVPRPPPALVRLVGDDHRRPVRPLRAVLARFVALLLAQHMRRNSVSRKFFSISSSLSLCSARRELHLARTARSYNLSVSNRTLPKRSKVTALPRPAFVRQFASRRPFEHANDTCKLMRPITSRNSCRDRMSSAKHPDRGWTTPWPVPEVPRRESPPPPRGVPGARGSLGEPPDSDPLEGEPRPGHRADPGRTRPASGSAPTSFTASSGKRSPRARSAVRRPPSGSASSTAGCVSPRASATSGRFPPGSSPSTDRHGSPPMKRASCAARLRPPPSRPLEPSGDREAPAWRRAAPGRNSKVRESPVRRDGAGANPVPTSHGGHARHAMEAQQHPAERFPLDLCECCCPLCCRFPSARGRRFPPPCLPSQDVPGLALVAARSSGHVPQGRHYTQPRGISIAPATASGRHAHGFARPCDSAPSAHPTHVSHSGIRLR